MTRRDVDDDDADRPLPARPATAGDDGPLDRPEAPEPNASSGHGSDDEYEPL
jgi:hypothetical protein